MSSRCGGRFYLAPSFLRRPLLLFLKKVDILFFFSKFAENLA